ncbi:histidine biosynthesis bifunctional protein HisIE [Alicyclobacillus hesperidum subsp. aegles]|uniref:bifunctional phosphoribosyl-AMP cyclohydrolase/phosphoribosyl-ATP diphosphatase HisIE n=1 Tax=Alicyclobacillus hesperidum TaxID=89784 RepID=UPI002228DD63|nr:bifunctional phosphoribosyl-AMP cyclohydrolase/phosphoribosyl-ATP diphosphatase HisIE [Alicyclobacillus hesperidum]GLF99972.1 histidine biosynthesis bifunctional protein HisIE [Alicyclobacillus hesperidum subsp. aegles]
MGGVKGEIDLAAVRYDTATGLVPVVVQDAETGTVLMLAYANREALKRTLATGYAWFWSRSRQEYWRKGATSGNVQEVVELRLDCDGDTVLYLVRPHGPACHTGEDTCFYRRLTHGSVEGAIPRGVVQEQEDARSGDDAIVTAKGWVNSAMAQSAMAEADRGAPLQMDWRVLDNLWQTIDERYRNRPQGSYTTYLFEHGALRIGKKVGEEATEAALAAVAYECRGGDQGELAAESADLLYHLMVLWRNAGLSPTDVLAVLAARA